MGTTFSLSDNTTNDTISDDYYIVNNPSIPVSYQVDELDKKCKPDEILNKLETIIEEPNVIEEIKNISKDVTNEVINQAIENVVVESQTRRKKKKKKIKKNENNFF